MSKLKSIKVLLVTGRSDPGGGPEHLWQLALRLRQQIEVFIAAPEEAPYWERFSAAVGAGHMLRLPGIAFRFSTVREIVAFARQQGIDLIHAHGRSAGATCRVASLWSGLPCIYTPHGPLNFRSAKAYPYSVFELLLAVLTKRIIAVSPSEAGILRRQLLFTKKINTIVNGVTIPETEVNRPAELPRPHRLVHATRYVFQKNSELVLEILALLREQGAEKAFEVDFLGDGPGRAELEALAESKGVRSMCVFHGAQPSIRPYLLAGFCFLTTSRWEGLPLAVIEALSVGLPVVGTATPGNIDVISSTVGGLFGLSEPRRAAELLLQLSSSRDEWTKKSEAARAEAIEAYSAERMTQETLTLYRSAV